MNSDNSANLSAFASLLHCRSHFYRWLSSQIDFTYAGRALTPHFYFADYAKFLVNNSLKRISMKMQLCQRSHRFCTAVLEACKIPRK